MESIMNKLVVPSTVKHLRGTKSYRDNLIIDQLARKQSNFTHPVVSLPCLQEFTTGRLLRLMYLLYILTSHLFKIRSVLSSLLVYPVVLSLVVS